jgi:hypothetical protein
MATDPAGNLYLADAANGIVWGAGPALDTVAVVAGGYPDLAPVAAPRALDTPLYQLHGIAVSPHGDLVLTSGNGVIQITAPGFVPPAPAAPIDLAQTQPGEEAPPLGDIPPPPPPPDAGDYAEGPDPLALLRNQAGRGKAPGGRAPEDPKRAVSAADILAARESMRKRSAKKPGGGGGVEAELARQRAERAQKAAADAKARQDAANQAHAAKARQRRALTPAPSGGPEAGQAPSGAPLGFTPVPAKVPAKVPAHASSSSPQVPVSASSSSPQVPVSASSSSPVATSGSPVPPAPAKRAKNQVMPDRPHALPESLMDEIRAAGAGRHRLTADQIKARDARQQEQRRKRLDNDLLGNLRDDPKLKALRYADNPENEQADNDDWDE